MFVLESNSTLRGLSLMSFSPSELPLTFSQCFPCVFSRVRPLTFFILEFRLITVRIKIKTEVGSQSSPHYFLHVPKLQNISL